MLQVHIVVSWSGQISNEGGGMWDWGTDTIANWLSKKPVGVAHWVTQFPCL